LRRGVLDEIASYLVKANFSSEVIISDDGSTDGSLDYLTANIGRYPSFKLIKNAHAGKPFALKSALKEASGDYVLFADMDQSTPLSELDKLLVPLKKGSRLVIGSRGSRRRDTTPLRQLASLIFLLARRAIILPRIKDTQCGFKLIEIGLAKKIFSKMQVFSREQQARGWKVTAYDVEMLFLARQMEVGISEVRVKWRNADLSKDKRRNFVGESIEMFGEILRVRLNHLLGKYD